MCPAHKIGYCSYNIMVLSTYFITLDSKDLIMWSTENIHLLRCDAMQCGQQATIFQNNLLSVPSWLVPPTLSFSYSVILKMEAADKLAITTHHFRSSPHGHNTWEMISGVWQHSWTWVDFFSFSWTRQIEDQPVRCMLLSTSHFKWQMGEQRFIPISHFAIGWVTDAHISAKVCYPKLSRKIFSCDTLVLELFHLKFQARAHITINYCMKTLQHLTTIIMSRICCRTALSDQDNYRTATNQLPLEWENCKKLGRDYVGWRTCGGCILYGS